MDSLSRILDLLLGPHNDFLLLKKSSFLTILSPLVSTVSTAALKGRSMRQLGLLQARLILLWTRNLNFTRHQLWGWWPPMASRWSRERSRAGSRWEVEVEVAGQAWGSRGGGTEEIRSQCDFTFTFLTLWTFYFLFFKSVDAWQRYERDRNMLQNSIKVSLS